MNIKAFNRVDRKQVNILKTFLEYLLLFTEDDSALIVVYHITFQELVAYKPAA